MSLPERTLRLVRGPDDPLPDRLLTAADVARRLSLSVSTVYLMAARDALPSVRFDGSHLVRFSERAVAALIERGGR